MNQQTELDKTLTEAVKRVKDKTAGANLNFTCSKCGKRLGFGGVNSLCVCVDCKKSFCADEGSIFKDSDRYIDIAKGTNDRIITDFLCYDCDKIKETEPKEILKNEQKKTLLEKEQDEAFARKAWEQEQTKLKEQQEQEQQAILKKWQSHSDNLPIFSNFSGDVKVGNAGEFNYCSGYVDLYGEKGNMTDIHLTFYYQGNRKSFCLKCSKIIIKGLEAILNNEEVLTNDPVRKKLDEMLKKSYYGNN